MAGNCGCVVAFKLEQRTDNATLVQEVLTKHGCLIKARLGLHEAAKDYCANHGIIILQCCGEQTQLDTLMVDLNAVPGVKAKCINLDD